VLATKGFEVDQQKKSAPPDAWHYHTLGMPVPDLPPDTLLNVEFTDDQGLLREALFKAAVPWQRVRRWQYAGPTGTAKLPADPALPPAPMHVRYPQYFREVPPGVTHIDTYRVGEMFDVTDPCLFHAMKKILLAGTRTGGKSLRVDIREAAASLYRWAEMRDEEEGGAEQAQAPITHPTISIHPNSHSYTVAYTGSGGGGGTHTTTSVPIQAQAVVRSCGTCKHGHIAPDQHPCDSCLGEVGNYNRPNWEPKA
jgi:hypothetical protein